jgi:transposase-like protein
MTRSGSTRERFVNAQYGWFSSTGGDHHSEWAAITSIANKLGVSSETLRKWVRRAEIDEGSRPGLATEGA